VRADAFIVKPFEATELLAALTKLEDKIVPQADSPRSGRSRSSAGEGARSDEDTGWKNRLSIPPGGKGRSPEGLEADDFGQGAPAEVAQEAQKSAPVAQQEKSAPIAQGVLKPEAEQTPAAKVQEISASIDKTAEPAKEKEPEKETVAVAQAESSASPEKAPASAEAAASTVPSGPRWVAESASLSADDTAVALDREMEKSLAANAAYDAGQQSAAAQKPEELEAVATQAEEVKAEESKSEEVKQEPPTIAVAETKVAESSSAAEIAAPAEITAEQPRSVAAEVTVSTKQEAYAAAASVGATASETVASESRATAITESDSAQTNGKQQLAAAWEQWQNVRESVLNSPVAEQITEVAAASLKSAAEASGNADIEAVTTPSASNPTNIANIVDSVLAELKPKLVEEIAKKLGNEKKK
jgi:hypothetical protein